MQKLNIRFQLKAESPITFFIFKLGDLQGSINLRHFMRKFFQSFICTLLLTACLTQDLLAQQSQAHNGVLGKLQECTPALAAAQAEAAKHHALCGSAVLSPIRGAPSRVHPPVQSDALDALGPVVPGSLWPDLTMRVGAIIVGSILARSGRCAMST